MLWSKNEVEANAPKTYPKNFLGRGICLHQRLQSLEKMRLLLDDGILQGLDGLLEIHFGGGLW